jgi:hypothetical protein
MASLQRLVCFGGADITPTLNRRRLVASHP